MEILKKFGALLLIIVIVGAALYDTIVAFSVNDTFVPGIATLALSVAAIPAVVKLIKFLAK